MPKIYAKHFILWLLRSVLGFLCDATPLRALVPLKRSLLRLQGANVGEQIIIASKLLVTIPAGLTIGKRAVLGPNARILCYAPITIGDDFLSAIGLTLHSGSHDPETLELDSAPIRIGNNVWCAANVTICSGVTIGDDVVIGAGSLVNKDLPTGVVAAGVPCRVLRPLDRKNRPISWSAWDRKL